MMASLLKINADSLKNVYSRLANILCIISAEKWRGWCEHTQKYVTGCERVIEAIDSSWEFFKITCVFYL